MRESRKNFSIKTSQFNNIKKAKIVLEKYGSISYYDLLVLGIKEAYKRRKKYIKKYDKEVFKIFK